MASRLRPNMAAVTSASITIVLLLVLFCAFVAFIYMAQVAAPAKEQLASMGFNNIPAPVVDLVGARFWLDLSSRNPASQAFTPSLAGALPPAELFYASCFFAGLLASNMAIRGRSRIIDAVLAALLGGAIFIIMTGMYNLFITEGWFPGSAAFSYFPADYGALFIATALYALSGTLFAAVINEARDAYASTKRKPAEKRHSREYERVKKKVSKW